MDLEAAERIFQSGGKDILEWRNGYFGVAERIFRSGGKDISEWRKGYFRAALIPGLLKRYCLG